MSDINYDDMPLMVPEGDDNDDSDYIMSDSDNIKALGELDTDDYVEFLVSNSYADDGVNDQDQVDSAHPQPDVESHKIEPTNDSSINHLMTTTAKAKLVKRSIADYLVVETPEERALRNQRDFEEIRTEREACEFRESEEQRMKEAKEQIANRERQQQFRDKERNKRIAAGWQPGQKRVGNVIVLQYLDTADCRHAETFGT